MVFILNRLDVIKKAAVKVSSSKNNMYLKVFLINSPHACTFFNPKFTLSMIIERGIYK
jgi:hypothetical protein